MALRIITTIFLGLSILAASLFATLWIIPFVESDDAAAAGEICHRAVDSDLVQGETVWLNHFGCYGGGFYWARDVFQFTPGSKFYLKENGERRWYRGTQLETAIQDFVYVKGMGIKGTNLQGLPKGNLIAPDWNGLGFKAYRFQSPPHVRAPEYGDVVVIPDWFLFAASMIAPTIALWNWRKRRAKQSQRGFPI